MKRLILTAAASAASMLSAGCTVGPDYQPPVMQTSAQFSATTQPATTNAQLATGVSQTNAQGANALTGKQADINANIGPPPPPKGEEPKPTPKKVDEIKPKSSPDNPPKLDDSPPNANEAGPNQ